MPDDATQEDKEAPEKKVGRDVWLGLAISFGILLVIFLIAGLYLFVGPTTPTQKKDFVQAVGVLVAGIAGVVGLFFTWRNLRLTRENTERQLQVAREGQERTQEATRETLRITEQAQITERFPRAIDQLGATDDGKPTLEIRLGGIYALERIAKDSPKKYYATIMEVLMAYVRENARLPSEEATKPPLEQHATAERSVPAEQQSERAERSSASAPQKKPRVDIQAVLNVLGRRDEARVAEEYRLQHDLQKTNLTGADFLEANLREVILSKANLGVANLMRADLSGADLSEANLSEADLREAHLMEANVREANFRGADLTGADLWKAKLRGADFSGAELQRANLQGADLQGADLREAYFWGADLQGADLRGPTSGESTSGRHP